MLLTSESKHIRHSLAKGFRKQGPWELLGTGIRKTKHLERICNGACEPGQVP